jgi:hypothetical protein
MTDSTSKPDKQRQASNQTSVGAGGKSSCKPGKNLSMHANVPVWDDCCSCEAEPYWLEMMQETEAGKHDRDD